MQTDSGRTAAGRGAGRMSWPAVYALATLQVVVTLGWMAYAHFQPRLLQRFGLTAFRTPLEIYLALVGPTLAPLFGSLSDRLARRGAGRVPVMISGSILAGAAFIAV